LKSGDEPVTNAGLRSKDDWVDQSDLTHRTAEPIHVALIDAAQTFGVGNVAQGDVAAIERARRG
jgi:hypothetical protein